LFVHDRSRKFLDRQNAGAVPVSSVRYNVHTKNPYNPKESRKTLPNNTAVQELPPPIITSPQAAFSSLSSLSLSRYQYQFFFTTTIHHLFLGRLGHRVQGASVLEPLNLRLVEGVVQLDLERLAVLGVDDHGDGLANGQLGAEDIDL
jgi:hypothetical protein